MVFFFLSFFLSFFFFWLILNFISHFFKDFIYLFFRERGREGKRGRETSVCGCLFHAPYWGLGLQPRHVPSLGIEPATLWFAGCQSVHWATPHRLNFLFDSEQFHYDVPWHSFFMVGVCWVSWIYSFLFSSTFFSYYVFKYFLCFFHPLGTSAT